MKSPTILDELEEQRRASVCNKSFFIKTRTQVCAQDIGLDLEDVELSGTVRHRLGVTIIVEKFIKRKTKRGHFPADDAETVDV